MLNSAELEIFSANKYENADTSWNFHIYYMKVPTLAGFSILISREFICASMFSKVEFSAISNMIFISRTKFMLS